jgi:hypothetical protein
MLRYGCGVLMGNDCLFVISGIGVSIGVIWDYLTGHITFGGGRVERLIGIASWRICVAPKTVPVVILIRVYAVLFACGANPTPDVGFYHGKAQHTEFRGQNLSGL